MQRGMSQRIPRRALLRISARPVARALSRRCTTLKTPLISRRSSGAGSCVRRGRLRRPTRPALKSRAMVTSSSCVETLMARSCAEAATTRDQSTLLAARTGLAVSSCGCPLRRTRHSRVTFRTVPSDFGFAISPLGLCHIRSPNTSSIPGSSRKVARFRRTAATSAGTSLVRPAHRATPPAGA